MLTLTDQRQGDEIEKHPLHYIILLYGGVDLSAILSELPTYLLITYFGVKELYDMHYITFLPVKTS